MQFEVDTVAISADVHLQGRPRALSTLEHLLLTSYDFSNVLLRQLSTNTLITLSQCSQSLHRHVRSIRLQVDEINFFPESDIEDDILHGRVSWWQERWRVFPNSPQRPPIYCLRRKDTTEDKMCGEDNATPQDRSQNDAKVVANLRHWKGPQRASYKYWSTKEWGAPALLRFLTPSSTIVATDYLMSLYLDGHPSVDNPLLRYIILSDNNSYLSNPDKPFHFPSLRYLSVQGCPNLTLDHTRKIFETLHYGLKRRWKTLSSRDPRSLNPSARYPLLLFKFAGAFTNDPDYIKSAEEAWRDSWGGRRVNENWGSIVSGVYLPQEEQEKDLEWVPARELARELDIHRNGFEYDKGMKTQVGRILLVLSSLPVNVKTDIGRHDWHALGWAEKLAVPKTVIPCVGGCREYVVCNPQSVHWKEGKIEKGLLLCRDMYCREFQCGQWHCFQCKAFICIECRDAAIASYPVTPDNVTKYKGPKNTWSNYYSYKYPQVTAREKAHTAATDQVYPAVASEHQMHSESKDLTTTEDNLNNATPGSEIVYISSWNKKGRTHADIQTFHPMVGKIEHWCCAGCLPYFERFFCPSCEKFSKKFPYGDCDEDCVSLCGKYSDCCPGCQRLMCDDCQAEFCHIPNRTWCVWCCSVVCTKRSCAKLCSFCYIAEDELASACVECWKEHYDETRGGIFLSEEAMREELREKWAKEAEEGKAEKDEKEWKEEDEWEDEESWGEVETEDEEGDKDETDEDEWDDEKNEGEEVAEDDEGDYDTDIYLREWHEGRNGGKCLRDSCNGIVLVCGDCKHPPLWKMKKRKAKATTNPREGYYLRDPQTRQLTPENHLPCQKCLDDIRFGRWEEGRVLLKSLYWKERLWSKCL